MSATSCPECGAAIGGFEACQSLFRDFNARAQTDPTLGSVWWAMVDAYAMQHVEQYGKSAKSYAAHLMGLCCFVDHRAQPAVYRSIHIWMDGPAKVQKPAVLVDRGTLTLMDVAAAPSRVPEWVADVWRAYESQQALAHGWLKQALEAPALRK